ncbi:MAG: hypothetical protein LBU91_07510 [Bacteroidales bacterium]|jgi:hypothetical protein|nr:hypothetical protein [Bacteroidales bacterium]
MKKITLIVGLLGLICFANKSYGAKKDSLKVKLSIGAIGGFAQNSSWSGDLFGGIIIPIKSIKLEANLGYSVFGNKTSYRGVNDVQFVSHGLFLDGNFYIIDGLYIGLKFALNFNWVNKESQKLFDDYPDIDSPTFFPGKAIYGQIGYYLPIGDILGLKFQAQAGLHNYKITEGWFLIDNTDSYLRDDRIELHAEFLYRLSVGLVFKL